MNKIIFFDADGVTIVQREKFFSQRLSEDYGINTEHIMPLFKNEFYKCVTGEMDLKEVLKSYIKSWGWKGSIDDLLRYWWEGENKPNIPVLEIIDKLRLQGIKCYLTTDQEKYRAEYIMKEIGLEKHLDGAFFSCDLGVSKNEREYWEKVLQKLGIKNYQEVQYWDDEQENVDTARDVGIEAHIYKNIDDLNTLINK